LRSFCRPDPHRERVLDDQNDRKNAQAASSFLEARPTKLWSEQPELGSIGGKAFPQMSPVRPFVPDDIPQAADLNWNVLRHGKGPSPPALRSYFERLYFHNPWVDKSLPSLVFEDATRKIVGFLGVVPRPMSVRGERLRAAFGSNLVVHPDSRSTLAGLHLVKTYLAGEQDISLSDSANELTAKVQKGLGATTLLLDSIHWSRPLRPSLYVLDAICRVSKNKLATALKSLAKPFGTLADNIITKISSSPFYQDVPRLRGELLRVDTLLSCYSDFSGKYALRPEYDHGSLKWLLDFMDQLKAYGEVQRSLLRNDKNEIVGWYIYYLKPGGVGEVVQIGGAKQFTTDILHHLFFDAWKQGAIGLHGRLEARLVEELSSVGCFFYRRGGWMQAHSHRPELLRIIQDGDAFLTRLDGEWCLTSN
jgi:hypothetical protein